MTARTLWVELGGRRYPVYLGQRLISSIGTFCRRHGIPERVVVLADRNSARVALHPVLRSLRKSGFEALPVVIPPGENQKSFRRVELVHAAMLKLRVSRQSALLALGGGVVGDVGGFVASTYRRGIPFVQCPTTLLSQIDSSVGGKNGVNHLSGKNAIGSFHQPRFVCSDVRILPTLPVREIRSGLGELIKYAFVGDPSLLGYMEENLEQIVQLEPKTILHVAERCLRIKTRLVGNDERETLPRGRAVLNVGHAIGHAIESLSRYRLRHGEAVFLGLIAESGISVNRGWLGGHHRDRLIEVYHRLGCRFSLREITPAMVIRHLYSGGGPRFVLPRSLGRVVIVNNVTKAEVREGLKHLHML